MLTNKCSLVSHMGWWVGFEVPGQFWLKYWALDLTHPPHPEIPWPILELLETSFLMCNDRAREWAQSIDI